MRDLDASIHFYVNGLGFTLHDRWEQDGTLVGVMLKAGTCYLGLSQDDFAKGRDRVKGQGIRVWLTTAQDLNAIADRAKAAGIVLDRDCTPLPWGEPAIEFTDPDGFKFTITAATQSA